MILPLKIPAMIMPPVSSSRDRRGESEITVKGKPPRESKNVNE
jgi:hypothetical protein